MKTPRKLPKYLTQASYGKEVGAFAIDAVFALALGLTLNFTLGSMVIAPAAGYNDARDDYYSLAETTGLYQRTEDGKSLQVFSFLDKDGAPLKDEALYNNWNVLHNAVWNYYFVQAGEAKGETAFDLEGFSSNHEIASADYQIDLGRFLYRTVYRIQIEGEEKIETPNKYFVAPLDEQGKPVYTLAPVLNEETAKKCEDKDEDIRLAAKKNVWQVYAGDSEKNAGLYSTACLDFMQQESARALEAIGSKAMYLAKLPSVLIPVFTFFFLIPSFMKRGKTLGKLFLKMSVVGQTGYKASRLSIVAHAFLTTFPFLFLLLPFNGSLTFLLVIFACLVEYIVMLLNKNHQCLHDMISRTIVIDDRLTEAIFDSPEEEEEYASSHDDALARMAKGEEDAFVSANVYVAPAVLDSRSIGAARKEAANITSFDEFEAKDVEAPAVATPIPEPEEEEPAEEKVLDEEHWMDDPEMAAMMAMDGLTGEEVLAMEEERPENDDEDVHDDGFVDEK